MYSSNKKENTQIQAKASLIRNIFVIPNVTSLQRASDKDREKNPHLI